MSKGSESLKGFDGIGNFANDTYLSEGHQYSLIICQRVLNNL